jgi:hypothetical protein
MPSNSTGLILGRNTAQWGGLYTGIVSFTALALPSLFPGNDWGAVQTVLAASVGLVGLFLAFLANQSLTPVSDPRLPIGTLVNMTDPDAPNGIVVEKKD